MDRTFISMIKPCPSDRAIIAVMQFYRMTESDVRELYMDEVHAMQRLLDKGIDPGNSKNLDKGKAR
jgi:hypothetical protein|tara:strand:+ start:22 stop:219 length:198 start_codon:yes stop_codon:yes gene_type:complete